MKKTKELTNYKRYERIKKSEVFSYTPFDYCEKHGYTYNVRNYLRDVYEVAQYLLRALKTIKLCREDENIFTDYYYVVKSEFSDKEKKAVKILNVGRAIFNELMLLKDSKYINPKLDEYIQIKMDKLAELPEVYRSPEWCENYQNLNPDEIDIFYYMDDDVYNMLMLDLSRYLTPHYYFSNIKACMLSIDIEDYLTIIGDAKGIIPGYTEITLDAFVRSKQDLEKMFTSIDKVSDELKELIAELKSMLMQNIFHEEEPIKVSESSVSKYSGIDEMFNALSQRDEYKIIISVIPEFAEYFKAFFNLGYMEYKEDKLKVHVPLYKNSFYAFLRDNDFMVNKQIDSVRTPLCKLFDQNIEKFRQDNIESSRYDGIKQDLINANVPLNK